MVWKISNEEDQVHAPWCGLQGPPSSPHSITSPLSLACLLWAPPASWPSPNKSSLEHIDFSPWVASLPFSAKLTSSLKEKSKIQLNLYLFPGFFFTVPELTGTVPRAPLAHLFVLFFSVSYMPPSVPWKLLENRCWIIFLTFLCHVHLAHSRHLRGVWSVAVRGTVSRPLSAQTTEHGVCSSCRMLIINPWVGCSRSFSPYP